ncbi:2-C-methyl-D-erythritol 4-phosphate cytidylyltransferase [Isoptericola sp. b441]|uniref:2-C-methyl-D-erythritol 4-phosphate cytidylyltransferase n=1 Tax=Actinotalea lenta TaxID=3064654 RepID=A0ABT9D7V0_9CELL|nr:MULTISPECIES: 2-C-methyl-D-erythritol 4-phosphate cytidylyltransferase [unclassified Isoptericola]MDO8106630.1 2-C-methyl-D-erythritol 4-phosphate cytidylyltransferase [Isoptericola sp. b441]MDO8121662.1 2-C-methyl-D-erythritol 4-phosphate cytidylyltransferase [Isoptericola sp. b490]
MTLAAVLVAAGSGTRLGRPMPKALVPLGGETILARAARALVCGCDARELSVLVVTAPPEHVAPFTDLVEALHLGVPTVVVAGRATRQGSVAAALEALEPFPAVDLVLVHDAARPGVPPEVVDRVVRALRAGHGAVVPAVAVVDTVKRVGAGDGDAEPVLETVPRLSLRAVQTPQGFDRALLERAHAAAARHAHDEAVAASDDAGLVEMLDEQVWVVAGDERSAKITTPRDLTVAELLLGREDR